MQGDFKGEELIFYMAIDELKLFLCAYKEKHKYKTMQLL